jgi:hypothetical protein
MFWRVAICLFAVALGMSWASSIKYKKSYNLDMITGYVEPIEEDDDVQEVNSNPNDMLN